MPDRRFAPPLDPLEPRVSLSRVAPGASGPGRAALVRAAAAPAAPAAPEPVALPFTWEDGGTFGARGSPWAKVPTAPAMSTELSLVGHPDVAAVRSQVFANTTRGVFGAVTVYAYVYEITTRDSSPLWGVNFPASAPIAVSALYGRRVGDLPPVTWLDWPGVFRNPPAAATPRGSLTVTVPPEPGHSVLVVAYSFNPPVLGDAQRLVSPVGWGAVPDPLSNLPVVYAP